MADASKLVALRGNVHPLARPEYDFGPAPDDLPMKRMLLVLQRSPEQEAELRHLLDEQQTRSSPNFHKWLTPKEFGERFGPAPQDIEAVTDWLTSQGFVVNRVTAGRAVIEFSGTAGLLRDALHTEIHQYNVNGEKHWANASDPQIPEALAPVVTGIASLHNFPLKPLHHVLGAFERSKATGEVKPLFTYSSNGKNYYPLGAYDFDTIYNVLPLWNAGIDGTGQSIAIVGESNIHIWDPREFRSIFGLPANDPQIIVDGQDPGVLFNGLQTEANLDVQWAGAVARNATIQLVVSQSTETTPGADLSALYIVDTNLAPVMSVSFGECETFLGAAANAFHNALWEQAAAQGITVVVASGDSGSATCDQGDFIALNGLSVNGLASTPFNLAVGGTDFNDFATQSTYWSSTNNPASGLSAMSYIPETPWNSSCASSGSLTACSGFAPFKPTGLDVVAGGGGASSLYAKPLWQAGLGVPSDAARDLPDVALFASIGVQSTGSTVVPGSHSFYIVCETDADNFLGCSLNQSNLVFLGVGGTSVSAPAFAGIMALINQKTGERQGNPNYVLYKLAAQSGASCASDATAVTKTSCTFYDIVTGNNSVACFRSPNCSRTTGAGVLVNPANTSQLAWTTNAGYDLATGLGSVNVANLVKDWSSVSFAPTATTLALSTSPATNPVTLTHGQPVNVNITVAPTSGTGTPTGDVSLIAETSSAPASTTTGIATFTLSGGTVTGATTDMLPGGTYSVKAHYAGDGTFAASDSASIQVNVTKENSKAAVSLVIIDPILGTVTNPSATTAPYGTLYLLRVDVTNSSGQKCSTNSVPCPSGQISLTNNGAPFDAGTYALNSQAFTEDQFTQLPGGTNNVGASYAGDRSFDASTATVPIVITPAPTGINPSSSYTALAGQPVPIGMTVFILTVDSEIRVPLAVPTGTVQLFNGSTPIGSPTPCQPTAGPPACFASPTVTLTANATLTAQYSGDSNYAPSTSAPFTVTMVLPTTTVLTPSSQSVIAGSSATVFAVVDGHATPAPSGNVQFLSNGVQISPATINYQLGTDSNGFPTLRATLVFTPNVSQQITALYSGDSNYYLSQSPPVQVTVAVPDFSLGANPASASINAGTSAAYTLTVSGTNGFTGNVSVTCSLPAAAATCSANPLSVAPGSTTTITVTTMAHQLIPPTPDSRRLRPLQKVLPLLLLLVLALILLAFGSSKRRWRLAASIPLTLVLFLMFHAAGCGGSGSTGPPPLHGTQAGNYTVAITGTSGSTAHTTTVSLNVQ